MFSYHIPPFITRVKCLAFALVSKYNLFVLIPNTKGGIALKVIDMHCDTFFEIYLAKKRGEKIVINSNHLTIDLNKMKAGDYLLQNFAMFIPLDRVENPLQALLEMIEIYDREIEENSEYIGKVFTYANIEENINAGKLSTMLTIEEGGACMGDLALLEKLHEKGVRMMTLTWNFENELAYPNTVASLSGYSPNSKYGLKELGFRFVEEMERLGIIVDVSHLSDDGFWDVCSVCKRPFVASHSNARSLCAHTRNLSDDMIRALSDRGGVIGMNFCNLFLDENNPISTIESIVRHIKYIKNVGGIDCVALGTDYDGIDCELEIYDASQMPKLAHEMSRQGFAHSEIEKVFYRNVLRVYKEML